ncbi:MAG: DegT/DnrJ/EryC1/StrS family aminotransferase [Lachnospiraceae bacterium]
MKIPFSPPDVGEEEIKEVTQVLKSGWLTTGPKTKELEKQMAQFCHTSRGVCLNSATACMEAVLRLFEIGEGDEVIVPAYTYTATASVVCHVGAKLVMVDTAPGSYHMNYDALEAAITDRTKAIMPVDIAGVVADYDRVRQIVESKKSLFKAESPMQEALGRILILADGAHSYGSVRNGRISGEMADFTSFSFHAVKNFTTGEGGGLVWRDIPGVDNEDIYRKFMLLSLHGQSKDALAKTQLGAWEYDIVAPMYKCNMTDIMAAIGLAQMKRYSLLLARRKEIITSYTQGLSGMNVKVLMHYSDQWGNPETEGILLNSTNRADDTFASCGHLYLVNLTDRDSSFRNSLITRMAQEGVATNVHYKPLPLLTAYRNLGFKAEDYPNAYNQFANEISLPLHTCLSNEQVEYVIDTFKTAYASLD